MTFISYAQNYEDVMLFRALRGVERGFYIDVGAQDPIEDSVTKAFYERGWHGINIEPVEHWYRRLDEDRPHDINLRVAVSDRPGELKLFDVEGTGLSTTDETFAARYRAQGLAVREHRVGCATLGSICAEHKVGVVHFLKVDCEGAEESALQGMSFDRVRPWIVLVEASEPNSTTPTHQQWESLLLERGYGFVYADGINRYYLADEHPELREAFASPPNVLDDFMRVGEDRAHRRARELHTELVQSRELVVNLQTQAMGLGVEIARLQSDTRGQGEEIARLQQEYRDNVAELVQVKAAFEQIRRSHSWRITRPLRVARRGIGAMRRAMVHGTKAVLRRPARRALKRLANHPALRKLAFAMMGGRDSALARRVRVFLFGPLPTVAPHHIARIGSELDSSVYSRRERVALSALQDAMPPSSTDAGE